MERLLLIAAALSAGSAVMAGAFGAHSLSGQGNAKAVELFKTASQYQFGHAIAVLALVSLSSSNMTLASSLLLIGSLIFALSLYALGLGAPSKLGIITPIGGALMVIGWIWAALRFGST